MFSSFNHLYYHYSELFSSRLSMSPSFFGGGLVNVLSYYFTCWIFLCLFMLLVCCVWGLLSSGWRVMVPLNCGVCSLWVELDQWLVKVSWLEELVSVFWWVEMDLLFLECNEVSSCQFLGFWGFGMALGSPFFNVHVFVPGCWRISMVCLSLGTSWLFGEAWFQCRCGDFWVSSSLLMFPWVRKSLIF